MSSFSGLKVLSGGIFEFDKMSGFLDRCSFIIIPYKFNAVVTFVMFKFFTGDNSESGA